jgi:hypothetical protein
MRLDYAFDDAAGHATSRESIPASFKSLAKAKCVTTEMTRPARLYEPGSRSEMMPVILCGRGASLNARSEAGTSLR